MEDTPEMLSTVQCKKYGWSITPDLGDLYDITLFCNTIHIELPVLLKLLTIKNIVFHVECDILWFVTEADAQTAISVILEYIKEEKSNLV